MRRAIFSTLRKFRRSETGSATIEFVITFPMIVTAMLSGIELGFVTMQHGMLERAVDMTVREIRLGTGTAPQHDEIKDLICERSGFIANCNSNLRLEMIQMDPRAWSGISSDVDCIDHEEPAEPPRNFTNGQENELMILRACALIDPVFPTSGLGKSLAEGTGGQYTLISTSAFVQEPR